MRPGHRAPSLRFSRLSQPATPGFPKSLAFTPSSSSTPAVSQAPTLHSPLTKFRIQKFAPKALHFMNFRWFVREGG
jgi:hypothetical protein